MGQGNHLFAFDEGDAVTGKFLILLKVTLLRSCQQHGVNPFDYLKDFFYTAAPTNTCTSSPSVPTSSMRYQ
jgi:hypothetical protein